MSILLLPLALEWKYGTVADVSITYTETTSATGKGRTYIPPEYDYTKPVAKIVGWRSSESQPTEDQFEALIAEYLAATSYIEARKKEYPPLADQLDALWKGGEDERKMRETVLAVKEKYPKP